MLHGLCERIPDYAQFGGGRTCLLRADDFRALVSWCTRQFDVIRSSDLDAIVSGALKVRRPLLITFDDALASLIDYGVPVLREHRVSALTFVTTDWTDSGRAPFILRLERRLFSDPPKQIEIRTTANTARSQGNEKWSIPVGSRAALPKALDALWSGLFARRMSPTHVTPDQVWLDGRIAEDSDVSSDREFWGPARWQELADAHASSTLEIGSHMRSHRPLPWLDEGDLERELAGSRAVLTERLNVDAATCSYPHGMVDARGERIASRAYKWAFLNRGGALTPASRRTAAPRVHVPGEHWSRVKFHVAFPALMRRLGR